MSRNGAIRVECLGKSITFADAGELAAYVEAMMRDRPGALSPLDFRVRERHRALEGGYMPSVRAPEPEPPTPYDERVEEAAAAQEAAIEARDAARAAWQAAKREAAEEVRKEGNHHRHLALAGRWREKIAELEAAYMVADERETRARARHTSLQLARQDWRIVQDMSGGEEGEREWPPPRRFDAYWRPVGERQSP